MADDLIVKFFREDLTEAEEAVLSDRLLSSVEDAVRFGQHAEASYRHYGLPDPKWPGSPPPPGFGARPGFKPGLWLPIVLLTGIAAWGIWKYWPSPNGAKPSASIPAAPSTVAFSHTLPKPSHSEKVEKEEVIPKQLTPDAVMPVPAITPVNTTAQPHHPHTNLEVLVKRAKPGPVTVKVLGPDGSQAVMLYQGLLQPGSWAFDWNGRLANGGAPPAGTYQIQVVSGAVTLSKPVIIRK